MATQPRSKTPGSAIASALEESKPETPQDKLDAIRDKVRKARDLELEIAELNARVKEKSDELNVIKAKELVDLFSEVGMDHFGLEAEGNNPAYDAERKPYYHANIPEDKAPAAFKWLDDEGHGDIIRTTITIAFGKDERKKAQRVEKSLEKAGIGYNTKLGVPWNTLTAFVKERIEKYEEDLPLSILGATVGQVVTIKPRKAK